MSNAFSYWLVIMTNQLENFSRKEKKTKEITNRYLFIASNFLSSLGKIVEKLKSSCK